MTEKSGDKRLESEFLQGVYQKVEVLKKEKRELEMIRAAKRDQLKRKIKVILASLLLNIPFLLMLPEMIAQNNQVMIMGWSFLLITLGSYIQYSSEIRRDVNGD
jgi:hypothetical protein